MISHITVWLIIQETRVGILNSLELPFHRKSPYFLIITMLQLALLQPVLKSCLPLAFAVSSLIALTKMAQNFPWYYPFPFLPLSWLTKTRNALPLMACMPPARCREPKLRPRLKINSSNAPLGFPLHPSQNICFSKKTLLSHAGSMYRLSEYTVCVCGEMKDMTWTQGIIQGTFVNMSVALLRQKST